MALAFFAAIFWGGAEVAGFIKAMFGHLLQPDDEPATSHSPRDILSSPTPNLSYEPNPF
ncbi:MAG: hypothetical protein IH623_10460 [Verrucomicrobia bacterium]|nr:hypothetical protein [Verrucomicrobiota bacterium]